MHYLVGIVLVVLFLMSPVGASEYRCDELGANCLCSEPMNTATYTQSGNYFNPADSTTKQCTVTSAGAGYTIERPAADIVGASSATHPAAFAALPSGATITRFMKAADNHSGIFFVGSWGHTSYYKRYAVRWYKYFSTNYSMGIKGTSCVGDKLIYTWQNQGGNYKGIINGSDAWNYYGFTGGQYTDNGVPYYKDCCHTGPITGGWRPNGASWLGKWMRFETIYTNRGVGMGPFNVQAYYTDVTTNPNGSRTKYVDLREACPTCGYYDGGWSPVPYLIPTESYGAVIANYREFGYSPGCLGYSGTSHVMYAGWDTDAGQFIGAATEMESGTAPVASTGTFTSFTASSILIALSILVAAVAMLGSILGVTAVRRRYVARHAGDWSDPPGQPLGAVPLDGPPAPSGHDVQPVVSDARADELVGVGSEMEGVGAARERVG